MTVETRHPPVSGLRRRQVAAVLRLEVKKNFLGRRALFLYLLALLPVGLLSLLLLASLLQPLPDGIRQMGASMVFASAVYQGFILRFSLYVGCVWIFMNLFRGEVLDRSLHYYFLSPIRREVLVAGKFLSGWITASILFGAATVVSYVLLQLAFGIPEAKQFLFEGPGLAHMFAYTGISVLGCLGYGAVFLLIGLFFRNPVIPALVIWGLEAINYLLPAALKKISVIHYLLSLSPVPVSEGAILAILAEPTPAWVSIPGLILVSAAALALAGLRIRHMEIQYGPD